MQTTSKLARMSLAGWACAFAWLGMAEVRAQRIVVGTDFMEMQAPICPQVVDCYAVFAPVPERKELLVTRVTCHISTTQPLGGLGSVVLGRQAGSSTNPSAKPPYTHLIPVLIGDGGEATGSLFQINSAASHPFMAGWRPTIRVSDDLSGGSLFKYECTLIGTYRDVLAP